MATSAPDLHCFVPTTLEVAPTGAGTLSSASVAVKDLFAVCHHTSSFGHPRWRETHSEATEHAEVIERLLHAGAGVVGITKMDQLAYSLIGNAGEGSPPVNPFDPECYCGGSSSGSASAVAGGLADISLGTDTAGSIRVPAAACGLFGLRASHGVISTVGAVPLAKTLDVVGFMARTPALLARAVGIAARGAGSDDFRPRRVLLPIDLRDHCAPSTWQALVALAQKLAAHIDAAFVEEPGLGELVDADVGDLFARIEGREIWSEHGTWIAENIDLLTVDVQTRLRRCQTLSNDAREAIDADLAERDAYRTRVRRLLSDDAVLVMPVLPERGPMVAWSDERLREFRVDCFRLTAPSSLAGVPQLVLPTTSDAGYVPLSLLGQHGADASLVRLAGDLAGDSTAVALP